MSEIMWLAGLLEGEGAFCLTKGSATIQLNMTDLDVVERARKLVNAPSIHMRPAHGNRKATYRWTLCGNHAVPWLEAILPHMGERRSGRIKELLAIQATKRPYRSVITACPHTARKHQGRGMCRACYQHDWYTRTKGRDAL